MQCRLAKSPLAALCVLLLCAGSANADTIVSNLSATVNGTGTIYASGPPQFYAQEFTTGAQAEQLTSIIAALGNLSGSVTVTAELVTNSAGLPGTTVLTGFVSPTIPSTSPTDVTFSPDLTVDLAADTNYWFILEAFGTGDYRWDYTNTLSSSLPNYAVSNNSGSSWLIGNPPGPFLIGVDGTPALAAPEPSALALLGTGILSMAGMARRRFSRS